ncbi:hypothetical protein ACOMHN_039928 [Nucella lapillus]
MACRPPCSDSCFLNKKNQEEVMDLACKTRDLIHRLQCSSTRAKGNSTSTCQSAGEVSPQAMGEVVEDLESASRQLLKDLKYHLTLHELHNLRISKGRAQSRDSGVVSWTPDSVPIQEEVADGDFELAASSEPRLLNTHEGPEDLRAADDIVEDNA